MSPLRAPLLGACVGSVVVIHLIIGVLSGSFGVVYIWSTIVHAGVALVGLQVHILYYMGYCIVISCLQYTLHALTTAGYDVLEVQLVHITMKIVLGALGAYAMGMSKIQADAKYRQEL